MRSPFPPSLGSYGGHGRVAPRRTSPAALTCSFCMSRRSFRAEADTATTVAVGGHCQSSFLGTTPWRGRAIRQGRLCRSASPSTGSGRALPPRNGQVFRATPRQWFPLKAYLYASLFPARTGHSAEMRVVSEPVRSFSRRLKNKASYPVLAIFLLART